MVGNTRLLLLLPLETTKVAPNNTVVLMLKPGNQTLPRLTQLINVVNAILTEEGPDLICLMWLQFIVDIEKNSDFAWYIYIKTVDQAFAMHFFIPSKSWLPKEENKTIIGKSCSFFKCTFSHLPVLRLIKLHNFSEQLKGTLIYLQV